MTLVQGALEQRGLALPISAYGLLAARLHHYSVTNKEGPKESINQVNSALVKSVGGVSCS